LGAETGDGRDDLQSLFLGALGGNASHESLLHGLTASSALALDVGGTALGGRQSSDEARNSALGDLGKVLGAGESEGSREGKDGSLETHVCFGGWWCLCERVVLVLRIDWNGITEDFCAKSKMEPLKAETIRNKALAAAFLKALALPIPSLRRNRPHPVSPMVINNQLRAKYYFF
jgi:hypothetical protein